ncbi:MAG: tripartite tricarboxylate transporter substrate-binding protein [Burkholderiaceae bacterium]
MSINRSRRRIGSFAMALCAAPLAGKAAAQAAFPNRPIRMMVGYSAGGGADALGRSFAAKFSHVLQQSVVVENRAGAGGTLAATALAGAQPDGHTLYWADSAILVAPAVYDKVAYDPLAFAPVSAICSLLYSIVVHPSFPARTVKELIAVLKADPDRYSYASPGVGNIAHLGAELFKKAAGVKMVHVPYKGGTPALTDLVSGQVPICFVSLPPVLPLAKAGRLRLLAVTSEKRSPVVPDVPAIAETFPGFNAVTSGFLLAPPGTPADVVGTLNKAARAAMAMPDLQADYIQKGALVATGTPDELAAQIRHELGVWGSTAREAGARAE